MPCTSQAPSSQRPWLHLLSPQFTGVVTEAQGGPITRQGHTLVSAGASISARPHSRGELFSILRADTPQNPCTKQIPPFSKPHPVCNHDCSRGLSPRGAHPQASESLPAPETKDLHSLKTQPVPPSEGVLPSPPQISSERTTRVMKWQLCPRREPRYCKRQRSSLTVRGWG